jgi:hypothetical protein
MPRAAYWNLYGPTETNVCTFAPIPLPVPDDRTQPYPIGPVCSHCAALVLDEQGAEQPRGGEGLLWIAGPSLFRGYWNRPDLDAQVFLQRDGRRWYNTGDVVREERDGFVYLGRRDRMVKRRGYRIELGEIETALQSHPGLREAAVVALPDAGDGLRIRAHVARAAHDGRPTIVDLKRFCASALPPFMSPDLFSFHEALPRTSTSKVDYQALLREPPPAPGSHPSRQPKRVPAWLPPIVRDLAHHGPNEEDELGLLAGYYEELLNASNEATHRSDPGRAGATRSGSTRRMSASTASSGTGPSPDSTSSPPRARASSPTATGSPTASASSRSRRGRGGSRSSATRSCGGSARRSAARSSRSSRRG